MKHMKRILSFALVLVMVLSCMPIQALATENTETAYVAINKTTGKGYESLLVAMSECRKGETVALQKDASEMQVLVPADGILDLNGCTLEAEYMSCFGDLIDSSDDNSGLLKVNEDYLLIRGDNKQLPIKDGTGFRFVEITKINTKMLTPTKFVFQPLFEAAALDLVAKGGDVTGLTVQVLVGWKQNDGYRTQEFVYNDDLLTQFLGSYNAATGKYSKMFTLTLNNVDGIEELSFAAVLASSTKVTISSATEKEEVTGNVTTDANNQVVNQVILDNGSASAVVSTGTQLVGGTNKVTLSATEMEKTTSNVTLGANEKMQSMNVHVEGVSVENTVPILVTLDKLAPEFLNQGNLKLYHVENGETVEMTRVYSLAEVDAHNEFYYDIATGTVTMALATFSEIAVVSDTTKAWEGKFDYTWYTNAVAPVNGEAVTEYVIANADQLAALSAIVGGMNGQTQDSFAGKTVKLIADINLGDKESENNPNIIFYPIGYYNSEGTYERTNTAITSGLRNFEGTFDGNGHTVSNFYQNTWEMKGDHNWYTPEEQYYRDGMGLFGRVYGGTIKNLTVKNFSSDGEITTTGTIAAYAEGATFENISIFNCNPRVYNIGNGGIVGCVGWYAKEAGLKTTFSNITVDNSNKISALWGSYDVACGGIVGQYYPTSGQSSANYPVNAGIHFENCHVAAQMDVYNDVCANYQYYAYRYTGMLIGSIRENVNGDDGHVYPKMDGITAKDCTVHFGTWNDYYYCELVDNTTASYTHDYQMSRLTEIKAIDGTTITYLDGTTGTVPASGRANYVIVDYTKGHGTENATCYHFLNGEVWTHDMGGIQTGIDENGDGQDDLKEDKQHIYLEFNNLVTGYGWGVTTKAVGDLDGVKILDRVEADSVVKFNGTANGQEFITGTTVTIGQLFQAKDQNEVKIDPTKVQVFVSAVGDNSDVSATYTANTTDWTQGTLTFSGAGAATITITDYYFCTPTTITVTVEDNQPVEKFDKKFDKDFLYRVGNADKSPVGIGYLFKAKEGIAVGTVEVTIEKIAGNASGAYTSNATWTNGTIQFSGTGVVKVTITDNDYCIPTELLLEVIDATNITSNVGTTTGGTFVMVSDINTSSYVNYWYCTLYGNGFTYSLKNAPTDYNSKQGHGVLILDGATFDNVKVEGDIYTQYGAFTTNAQYNAAIDIKGDSTIQNCWIANCAAPITIRSTGATIKNTTLYGGAVANLIINSGKVILENVTTVNYADGRSMVGMGIVIHSDANDTAKLVLNGTLEQYNFISENMSVTDTYAKNLFAAMFDSGCAVYHFGSNPKYVNTGIISLTETFNEKDITDNRETGYRYIGTAVSLSGYDGYVYTQPNTVGSVDNNYNKTSDPHYGTAQGAVPPSYEFDYTDKNYIPKQDGSNDHCYFEGGKVNISMDEGDTFHWDTSILTVSKAGSSLQYKVTMNGVDYTGKSIAFNKAGEYTVEYTYTDGNNYCLDANGNLSTYAANYTKTVHIIVAVEEAATKHAEFTFGSSNTASTTVTIGNTTYVMPNVSGTSSTIGSTTVSGQTIYYPIVEIIMSDGKTSHSSGWYAYFPVFSGTVTITDYADAGKSDTKIIYNGSTTTMPTNLSIVGDPSTLFKYQSKSAAGTAPVVKSSKLVYSSAKIEANREEYSLVVQYSYTDNAGATFYYYIGYHAPKQTYSNTCVTGDTMVTLADGSTKRIDEVTSTDLLLVWNFFDGKYDVAPAAVIFDHGFSYSKVMALTFSDGTTVKVVNMHQFFDVDLNQFVSITAENVADFVGHKYASLNGNVELVSYTITEEYVEAWGVMTALHYNIFVEGMLSSDFELKDADLFHYFQVGADMKFDEAQMQADIEKYGLYTYEDFADYLTYEQFVAFNAQYLKIPVSKGLYTFEGILELINTYL